jgi:ADP-ribose pyrophosphatase YjhB (NUDIX family)
MRKPHRIAAGGFIFNNEKILLVRYEDSRSFLVGPWGGLEDEENIVQAVIRETKEETGITVKPKRVVVIEDLECSRYKMIKVWMVSECVEGVIKKTAEAAAENIIEAAWFTRDQLSGEVVYPPTLMQYDWKDLQAESWQVECLPSRKADF